MIRITSQLYNLLDAIFPDTPKFALLRAQLVAKLLGAKIGAGTSIKKGVKFGVNALGFSCGNDCFINTGCVIETENGRSTVTFGNNVWIGQEVMFTVGSHIIGDADQRAGTGTCEPIFIGDGVWIGSRSVVLQNVSVGRGAIVGAMALVNRDVEENTVAAGVPAKRIRNLDEDAYIRKAS